MKICYLYCKQNLRKIDLITKLIIFFRKPLEKPALFSACIFLSHGYLEHVCFFLNILLFKYTVRFLLPKMPYQVISIYLKKN